VDEVLLEAHTKLKEVHIYCPYISHCSGIFCKLARVWTKNFGTIERILITAREVPLSSVPRPMDLQHRREVIDRTVAKVNFGLGLSGKMDSVASLGWDGEETWFWKAEKGKVLEWKGPEVASEQ
jgi:hypothetical protein